MKTFISHLTNGKKCSGSGLKKIAIPVPRASARIKVTYLAKYLLCTSMSSLKIKNPLIDVTRIANTIVTMRNPSDSSSSPITKQQKTTDERIPIKTIIFWAVFIAPPFSSS